MSTVLITGASSGIGKAVAGRFMERGDEVIGIARRVETMPVGVTPIGLDLADPSAVASELHDGPLARVSIDVLVHCAGYGDLAPVELTSADSARRQIEVGVISAMTLAQHVLPGMRDRGQGRIVLVSSIASAFSSPMGGWYHAGKAALESLADALRQEVAGFGVDVVVVRPGVVETSWHDTALADLTSATAGTPYERMAAATADYHRRSASSSMVSRVDAVAEVIVDAATSSHPRTRYLVGRGSRAALTLPRLLPDRVFDRITARAFGIR